MAETIGSLVDKICIAELKTYYMQQQVDRTDAEEAHREKCRQRVEIITRQKKDLCAELDDLIQRWSNGTWTPKVYRQFKMYNDPKYRIPAETARVR